MGRRKRTGVDVATTVLLSNFAPTPTAVPQQPSAGNVGVLDFTLATSFAETSTLLAAAARGGGGNAEGVDVAAIVLPSRFAPTPTPSSSFLLTMVTMLLGGVGVLDAVSRSTFARTSTAATALQENVAMTSGAHNDFRTNFAATLATDPRGEEGGA